MVAVVFVCVLLKIWNFNLGDAGISGYVKETPHARTHVYMRVLINI